MAQVVLVQGEHRVAARKIAASAPKPEPGRDAAGRRRTAAISARTCNQANAELAINRALLVGEFRGPTPGAVGTCIGVKAVLSARRLGGLSRLPVCVTQGRSVCTIQMLDSQ